MKELISCPKWADNETIDEANCRRRIADQFGTGGVMCCECPTFASHRSDLLKKTLAELDADLYQDAGKAWLAWYAGYEADEIAVALDVSEEEALAMVMHFSDRPARAQARLLQ